MIILNKLFIQKKNDSLLNLIRIYVKNLVNFVKIVSKILKKLYRYLKEHSEIKLIDIIKFFKEFSNKFSNIINVIFMFRTYEHLLKVKITPKITEGGEISPKEKNYIEFEIRFSKTNIHKSEIKIEISTPLIKLTNSLNSIINNSFIKQKFENEVIKDTIYFGKILMFIVELYENYLSMLNKLGRNIEKMIKIVS